MRKTITGLYVDTETGGLDPQLHALTSICVGSFVLYPDQEPEIESFYASICPIPALIVTDKALQVQGITRASLWASPRVLEKDALGDLSYWLWNEGQIWQLPIWAHNADFDRGFLSAACDRYHPGWHKASGHQLATTNLSVCALAGRDARWNCTRYLAEKLVTQGRLELPRKADGVGSVSLDPLMERLGIAGRVGAGHDAHEDVRLGVTVLDRLLRLDGWWDDEMQT
ncbi:hypothetical protein [Armatimonas sp.]|uniref:3'-5' exonuclease n=1 Tax=Armatimonas sp. TaxID=1872638 RepID=UPI00375202C3